MNQPLFCVPRLIQQPTWGADFIRYKKKLDNLPALQEMNIGQSYELFDGVQVLAMDQYEQWTHVVELSDSKGSLNITLPADTEATALDDLIQNDPQSMLGSYVVQKFSDRITILNKLTQALGNSFQIHIKPEDEGITDKKAKPETWYYLSPGYLTCGVKPDIDWEEYQATCKRIDQRMQELSDGVEDGVLPLQKARLQAKEYIAEQNPWQFVNQAETQTGDIVDLSSGGIHHSWEEDSERFPDGNILYEIQRNRMDDESTLRCFDQGKIKDDGSIRKLNIDDYFSFIDRSSEGNDPARRKIRPKDIDYPGGGRVSEIVRNDEYVLDRIQLSITESTCRGIDLADRYHHLYVQSGEVEIIWDTADKGQPPIALKEGWSYFIPASLQSYTLGLISSSAEAEILKTYVP